MMKKEDINTDAISDVIRLCLFGLLFLGFALWIQWGGSHHYIDLARHWTLRLSNDPSALHRMAGLLLFVAVGGLLISLGLPRIWFSAAAGAVCGVTWGVVVSVIASLGGAAVLFWVGRSFLSGMVPAPNSRENGPLEVGPAKKCILVGTLPEVVPVCQLHPDQPALRQLLYPFFRLHKRLPDRVLAIYHHVCGVRAWWISWECPSNPFSASPFWGPPSLFENGCPASIRINRGCSFDNPYGESSYQYCQRNGTTEARPTDPDTVHRSLLRRRLGRAIWFSPSMGTG